jgi:hypothetical protein
VGRVRGAIYPTETDAGVVFTDILTLLVGEEHVGRETTLGSVGICEWSEYVVKYLVHIYAPFFFLSAPRALLLVAALAFLGISSDEEALLTAFLDLVVLVFEAALLVATLAMLRVKRWDER